VVSAAIWRRREARPKIGIVALARKLLIALWRYLETGVVPDGAQLKPMAV
jgi:transposase